MIDSSGSFCIEYGVVRTVHVHCRLLAIKVRESVLGEDFKEDGVKDGAARGIFLVLSPFI